VLSNQDLAERCGKLTASRMCDAMAFTAGRTLKDGTVRERRPKAERNDYMMAVVSERLTGILIPHYRTPAMLHGEEYEPLAKIAYMAATGRDVIDGTFLDHQTIDGFGATPDGHVLDQNEVRGMRGHIECKCPTTTTFIEWLTAGVVPEEHKPQMCAQMLVTGCRWCDFVAFDPRMPKDRQLFIRRYRPTAEELNEVEAAAVQFLAEVEELFKRVSEAEVIA